MRISVNLHVVPRMWWRKASRQGVSPEKVNGHQPRKVKNTDENARKDTKIPEV